MAVSQRAFDRAMSACARCSARVVFVRLDTGKAMPIDPTPSLDGTVAVMRNPAGNLIGRVVSKALPLMPYEQLHVTHFASCRAASPADRRAAGSTNVIDLSAARRDRRGQGQLW